LREISDVSRVERRTVVAIAIVGVGPPFIASARGESDNVP